MRRLRGQYPGWTPPADLSTLRAATGQGPGVDAAPIWSRIERGDVVGVGARLDQARATSPGWTPDAEMLRLIELSESQAAFDAAYAHRDAGAAIAAARRTPAMMRCDRINNAWRLAEMYQADGQRDAAVATWRGTAGACTRQADVVATLEKANEVATWPEMQQMFAAARASAPANARALDEVEARLAAGRGQRGPAAPAAATTPRAAAPQGQPPAATAMAPPAQVPAAASGGLPLRGDSRLSEARRLKEAGQWAACLAASSEPRSIDILYERSWCAYNLDRAGEALAGFAATERTGAALGGDINRDSRFGMILSYLALNMTEEGARLAAVTTLTREQRVGVEATILDQRGVRAYQSRDYAGAIGYFNALEALTGPIRRDLAMLRGYAFMQTGNHPAAHAEFTRLHTQLATDETRAALRSVAGMIGG
jgi:cellulose synthase operon protein C